MTFLLVCDGPDKLNGLEEGLAAVTGTTIMRMHSGSEALAALEKNTLKADLIVVDETVDGQPGKSLIERMVAVNAMVNTALVSALSDEDFHEYTEGFGVLMRIPREPGPAEATRVVEHLSKVLSLYQQMGS
jgi:DNA-binding response OmpR family regulator